MLSVLESRTLVVQCYHDDDLCRDDPYSTRQTVDSSIMQAVNQKMTPICAKASSGGPPYQAIQLLMEWTGINDLTVHEIHVHVTKADGEYFWRLWTNHVKCVMKQGTCSCGSSLGYFPAPSTTLRHCKTRGVNTWRDEAGCVVKTEHSI